MKNLNLVTFNIRCFGFDGHYFGNSRTETRILSLKKFIAKNFNKADVFILQEIMDLEIVNKILPEGFKFFHYTHEYPRHMHVVLACRENYDFKQINLVPNTTLDDTKSRPVIYGLLTENNLPLLHILGVHLKSGFEHTEKRIYQCQSIRDFIETLDAKIPVVLGGDFNSHFKSRTGKEKDDLEFFKILFDSQMSLSFHGQKTYVLPTEDAQLDHFWTKDCDIQSISVYDIKTYSEANSLKNYYHEISDHLPVCLEVNLAAGGKVPASPT